MPIRHAFAILLAMLLAATDANAETSQNPAAAFSPGRSFAFTPDADSPAERVLAEFQRPTPDGRTYYVFRFVEDDGAIATLIGTPQGYPAPVDDACALDTFLKVAPDDLVVPIELRRACGDAHDTKPRRVADLRTATLTFTDKALNAKASTGPFCALPEYEARFDKMLSAAKIQAATIEFEQVCDLWTNRDLVHGTCTASVPSTGETAICDFDEITEHCGIENPCCLQEHPEPHPILNPACAHEVKSWSSPLQWLDWEGDTGYGASKFQAEVSACDPQSTTVIFWMKRNSVNDAWGPLHETVLAGSFWWVLKLDSGTSNGNYRGARYLVHANGSGVRPAYAAAMMQGIDRSSCPMPFPL